MPSASEGSGMTQQAAGRPAPLGPAQGTPI